MSTIQRPGAGRRAQAARERAAEFGLPFVTLDVNDIEDGAFHSLPRTLLKRGELLPYAVTDGRLQVAVADPADVGLIDELRLVATMPVDLSVATAEEIARLCLEGPPAARKVEPDDHDSHTPAAQALDDIVALAVERRASDVHLLPTPSGLEVRFRIDGVVSTQTVLTSETGAGVIARLKVIAKLDIAEHRVGQDGRYKTVAKGGRPIDIRVATLPTIVGEGAVMRLLETSRRAPSLTEIGMSYTMQMALERFTGRLGAALVVAGPTGAGKSTTLYAALADLIRPDVNIVTVEDPVEYRLPDVFQLQVEQRAGFTFARALRTILRSDPDIIMVGEVRDGETATISIQAALTGHLVLTSLHSRDAPSALMRLVDLGVEPFLLASGLGAVVSQRLARRLCRHCREPYAPSGEELAAAGWDDPPAELFRAHGCNRCSNGYSGRIGVFELMPVTPELVEALVRHSASGPVGDELAEPRKTMWADGLEKAAAGDLSLDELRRLLQ